MSARNTIVSFDAGDLFERLEAAAERLGLSAVERRELEHLVHVVSRCSAILDNVYTDDRLQAILVEDPRRLTRLLTMPFFPLHPDIELPGPLQRMRRLPDEAREVGDQALFDLAISGRGLVRGVALDDLGPRAYRLAADVLELLAADARLREHFQFQVSAAGHGIEEEVGFLRRCSDRFSVYARMLRFAGDGPEDDEVPKSAQVRGIGPGPSGLVLPAKTDSPPDAALVPFAAPGLAALAGAAGPSAESGEEVGAPAGAFGGSGLSAEALLGAYERLLLFASLDLAALREDVTSVLVDQQEAVDTLIDDFSLFAVGTQSLVRPQSYFLVGPTGVGKNYLVETLIEVLERQWQLEVPLLTIEGPNYTYPSDINELRGATRGFIRSDEPGLLTEFHKRSSEAPLAVILVDEVEKAHGQLRKFFLSIMDRGVTTDAQGNELSFANTLIFFTSNIGYKERSASSHPIGFGGEGEAAAVYRAELGAALRRALSPEFINRVKLVRFAHLPRSSARAILDLEFEKIAERYREVHGLEVVLSDAGREALLDEGYSHEYGARHLAATLQRTCNVEISKMLRSDEAGAPPRDPSALLALVRDMRSGQRPIGLEELDRRILDQARARVDYRRIVVDAEGGRIVYRREK